MLRGNLEIVYVVFLKVQIALGGKIGGRKHGDKRPAPQPEQDPYDAEND